MPIMIHRVSLTHTLSYNYTQETVKTRMQVSGLSIRATASEIYSREGLAAFWKGLFFAYGREWSYTAIKLGAYAPVRNMLMGNDRSKQDAPFHLKLFAGAITGSIGSAIGNPFDVMKTLAQTNRAEPLPMAALVGRMYEDRGVRGFYRGLQANVARACVLNATQMGVYDATKGFVTQSSTSGEDHLSFLLTLTVC